MSEPKRTGGLDPRAGDWHAQVERYARDLRASVLREREAQHQVDAIAAQLEAYAKDLHKLIAAEQERSHQLENAYRDTILRLARASAFRDDETQTHAGRLGLYARVVVRHLELPEDEAERIATVAPMHDIGKIGIPDAILLKAGPLDPDEWEIMKRHAAIGASLLKGSNSELIETARLVALTHHESWDGSGYPQGLRQHQIPLAGRIVKLVDVYDALRSRRPYKEPHSHDEACRRLREGDARVQPEHFDPALLQVFEEVHGELARIFAEHGDPGA